MWESCGIHIMYDWSARGSHTGFTWNSCHLETPESGQSRHPWLCLNPLQCSSIYHTFPIPSVYIVLKVWSVKYFMKGYLGLVPDPLIWAHALKKQELFLFMVHYREHQTTSDKTCLDSLKLFNEEYLKLKYHSYCMFSWSSSGGSNYGISAFSWVWICGSHVRFTWHSHGIHMGVIRCSSSLSLTFWVTNAIGGQFS